MGVFKRSDRDGFRIEFVYKGNTYKKTVSGVTKAQARAIEQGWRQRLIEEEELGKLPAMTLAEATTRYFSETVIARMKRNSPATMKAARSHLKRILSHFPEDVQLTSIKEGEISKFRQALQKDGLGNDGQDRVLQVLRAILNRAQKIWKTVRVVPFVEMLNDKVERDRYLDPAEEARLLAAAKKDRELYDLLVFIIDTGARRGEALRLEWPFFEWTSNMVVFPKQITKTKKGRVIPLTTRCREIMLQRQKDGYKQPFMYELDGTRPDGRKGSRGAIRKDQASGLRAAWKKALADAKITDYRLHDLRHQYASNVLNTGEVGRDLLSDILGHRDKRSTERYARFIPASIQRAADALNRRGESSHQSEPTPSPSSEPAPQASQPAEGPCEPASGH